MLSTNLPLMKANLNVLLTASKGNPVYDAAYNAYYKAGEKSFEDQQKNINTINTNNQAYNTNIDYSSANNKEIDETLKKYSDVFATEFCNNLKSGGFLDSIADEIDSHIKSMMLSINVPVIPPTLISPVGPVTGSLMISEMAGSQITIS